MNKEVKTIKLWKVMIDNREELQSNFKTKKDAVEWVKKWIDSHYVSFQDFFENSGNRNSIRIEDYDLLIFE